MKHTRWHGILSLVLIVSVFAGCGSKPSTDAAPEATPLPPTPAASELVEGPQETPIETAAPDERKAQLVVIGDRFVCIDERLGLIMELPMAWAGEIEIEAAYDLNDRVWHSIEFYHKATREESKAGTLFHVYCVPGVWTEDEPPVVSGHSKEVLQSDDYTFFFKTPSDVQWSERNEELEREYKKLVQDFDLIEYHIYG